MILRAFSNFLCIIVALLICLPSKSEEKIDIWNNNKKLNNSEQINKERSKNQTKNSK